MRAAWYERHGPANDVLTVGELPNPEPAVGEVLVEIQASGINPSDVKRRAGWRGVQAMPGQTIPHGDGAGKIVAVGEGVAKERIGDRIWTFSTSKQRTDGTAAELVALPEVQAVHLPDNISYQLGACLGVPASTAYDAVFSGGSVDGKIVLVQGGAGAVGNLAIQFAKSDGAQVITTVSSDEKAAVARQAGADHVINYQQGNVVDRIENLVGNNNVHRVVEVDLAANIAIDVAVIAPNGTIASYSSTSNGEPLLPYYPLAYKAVTIRFVQAYLLTDEGRNAANSAINLGLKEGWLTPMIGAAFPLSDVASAHQAVEKGTIGNVILEL